MKRIVRDLRDAWAWEHAETPHPEPADFMLEIGREICAAIICRIVGHDIEGECHAGPESAVEELSCRRCSWSDRIVWY